MALTQQEKDLVKTLRDKGYNTRQIAGFIGGQRLNQGSSVSEDISQQLSLTSSPEDPKSGFVSRIKDIPSDISETASGVRKAVSQGVKTGRQAAGDVVEGKISPAKGTLRVIGAGLKAGSRAVGETIIGGLKTLVSPAGEEAVSGAASKAASAVVGTSLAQSLIQKYQELDDEQKKDVDAVLGVTEGLLDIGVLGVANRFARPVVQRAIDVADNALTGVKDASKTLFAGRRVLGTVDDVIKEADDVLKQGRKVDVDTATARTLAEAQAPELTLGERWVGITPDVKKRIGQAGPVKTQEYLDVVARRNVDDTAPTAFEFGGDQARKAVEGMEALLDNTGSQIGRTRQRFGNLRASIDQVNNIEEVFSKQLSKLNLELRNGRVAQKPGTIARVGSASDINTIQSLFSELKTLKQNPTLTNLIDFRNVVQSQVNFLKSGREISDAVDPFARTVRKQVKDEAAKVIGKSEANLLDNYADFMDAFSDLKSFTDRKAGGEYLLRLALSGRGGEARKIIQTIKDYTGLDLMDDAVLMVTVTDLLANESQKTLFKQALTRAGIDAARVLAGDPRGAIPFIGKFIENRLFSPEEILKEAAQR